MARIGNLAAAVGLFGGVAAGALGERNAEAAFTGYTVVATNITNSGQNLVRYEVFAVFNGPTDTVLNCFNFWPAGSNWNSPSNCGFWHKDNSDYNGGVLSQQHGIWSPALTGSVTANRPFDSYVTIGGIASPTNSTNMDPGWNDAGGWNQACVVGNPSSIGPIGYQNSSPPNNQGRVGNSPSGGTGFAAVPTGGVRLGQFILSQGDTVNRTYNLRLAYNDGAGGGVQFVETTFSLPAPGAIALLGLAGLAGRRRR